MVALPSTNHSIPIVPMPYVEEQARILEYRRQRRPLMLDMFVSNRWLFQQDFLYRKEQVEKMVRESQRSQPKRNPPLTCSVSDLHGWRKLAWYVVGLLDNVCHIGRVAA